jgi:hypothetical protein
MKTATKRRSFLNGGLSAADVGLLASGSSLFANEGAPRSPTKFPQRIFNVERADTVDLEPFRTPRGVTAPGSSGMLRLTNHMQLVVDTSCWNRNRSNVDYPDLDHNFALPQLLPTPAVGPHPAIPRTDCRHNGFKLPASGPERSPDACRLDV